MSKTVFKVEKITPTIYRVTEYNTVFFGLFLKKRLSYHTLKGTGIGDLIGEPNLKPVIIDRGPKDDGMKVEVLQ